mmetsp:Transcript_95831/g.297836  ORF Transcript_95831/g.297836 Transcript_95831/m.297836 type:complete len:221 (+) Transcript_95831:208-870(+)
MFWPGSKTSRIMTSAMRPNVSSAMLQKKGHCLRAAMVRSRCSFVFSETGALHDARLRFQPPCASAERPNLRLGTTRGGSSKSSISLLEESSWLMLRESSRHMSSRMVTALLRALRRVPTLRAEPRWPLEPLRGREQLLTRRSLAFSSAESAVGAHSRAGGCSSTSPQRKSRVLLPSSCSSRRCAWGVRAAEDAMPVPAAVASASAPPKSWTPATACCCAA